MEGERRQQERVICLEKRQSIFSNSGSNFVLYDISKGGVAILSQSILKPGERLNLKVSDDQQIAILVEVVHCEMIEVDADLMEYTYRVGTRFAAEQSMATWAIFYDLLSAELKKQVAQLMSG